MRDLVMMHRQVMSHTYISHTSQVRKAHAACRYCRACRRCRTEAASVPQLLWLTYADKDDE